MIESPDTSVREHVRQKCNQRCGKETHARTEHLTGERECDQYKQTSACNSQHGSLREQRPYRVLGHDLFVYKVVP